MTGEERSGRKGAGRRGRHVSSKGVPERTAAASGRAKALLRGRSGEKKACAARGWSRLSRCAMIRGCGESSKRSNSSRKTGVQRTEMKGGDQVETGDASGTGAAGGGAMQEQRDGRVGQRLGREGS